MTVLLTVSTFTLSLYVYLGGNLPIKQRLNLLKFRKLQVPNLRFNQSKIKDQEFLEYLWFLKSELSSGVHITNLKNVPPTHNLSARLILVRELSAETGTALTAVLSRLIKQTKHQIELQQQIATELASTKATILVLATLPVLGLFLSNLLSANSTKWLLQTSLGNFCLVIGVTLNLLGITWVRRIIHKSLAN